MSRLGRIVVILIIFFQGSDCLSKNKFLDPVVNKVLNLNVSQICIFKNEASKNDSVQLNSIFGKLSREIPTFIIDIDKKFVTNTSYQEMKAISRTLNSDLYLMIENAKDFDVRKIKKNLNLIAKLNPTPPRAKFLVAIVGDSRTFESDLKEIFNYAWALKFLDFTVVMACNGNNSNILNYNPFLETYDKEDINSGEFFPDKLKNMNGHKVKTILFNLPPTIEFNNDSNKIMINGVNYGFFKLTSEFLNFTFNYVEIYKNKPPMDYLFKKLEDGKIDVSITTHGIGTWLVDLYKKGAILTGTVVREANFNLIGPIFHTNIYQYEIYFKIAKHSGLTVLIILVTMAVIRFFKLSSIIWTPFYVFALLFGITADKKQKKRLDRLLYISLTIISIKYSSDVFAIFTDDQVVKNAEVIRDAFEEIKNPSLPIYLHKAHFTSKVYYDDEVIQNLKAHSIPIDVEDACYSNLTAQEKHFCFNSVIYANYMIRKYRNSDKSTAMKVINPTLLGDFFVHIFAKGSPYMRKFDKKFRQIFESGLHDCIFHGKMYFESHKLQDQNVSFKAGDDIHNQLIILTIGCVLAVLTFVFEHITESRKNKILRLNGDVKLDVKFLQNVSRFLNCLKYSLKKKVFRLLPATKPSEHRG